MLLQFLILEFLFDLKSWGFEPNPEQTQAIWSLILERENDYLSVTMTGTPFEPEFTLAYVHKENAEFDLVTLTCPQTMRILVKAYLRLMAVRE